MRLSSAVWVASTSGLLWFLLFYLPTFMRRHKSPAWVCVCVVCRKCALSALYMLMPEWRQTPYAHTTHYVYAMSSYQTQGKILQVSVSEITI